MIHNVNRVRYKDIQLRYRRKSYFVVFRLCKFCRNFNKKIMQIKKHFLGISIL